jgi:deazaflavin-dependent oxidoreductase (nitroreductase family)
MAHEAVSPAGDQPTPKERKRNPFTRSAQGGRVLSALMLPFFLVRPPACFGVLTTTGRRTGKRRRKCVRVIRDGDRAYLVMLGPALLGRSGPGTTSAWLWNIRANPNVDLRIRGGRFAGVARELEDGGEKERARHAYCEPVTAFDYLECNFHLGGRANRDRIQDLHRHWFETGVPVAIDLTPALRG